MPGVALLAALVLSQPGAGQESLDIQMVGDRVSIHAEGIQLGNLLGELDAVTGTVSTVGPDLESYTVNVWFDGLTLDPAIKKVFEGLPLDYAVVGGSRIVVMDVSEPEVRRRPRPTSVNRVNLEPDPVDPAGTPRQPTQNPFQIPGQVQPEAAGARQPDPATRFNSGTTPVPEPVGEAFPFGGPLGTGMAPPGFQNDQNLFGNSSPAILDLRRPQPAAQPPPAPVDPQP